jgi:hypothetical protein
VSVVIVESPPSPLAVSGATMLAVAGDDEGSSSPVSNPPNAVDAATAATMATPAVRTVVAIAASLDSL